MNKIKITEAIVLAGGSGKRLAPFTYYTSKHLLPVGNVPMITYPLMNLALLGVNKVLMIINPSHENQWLSLMAVSNFPFEIQLVKQNEPNGISQAIFLCRELLQTKNFYVALGDNIILSSSFISRFKQASEASPAVIATFKTSRPQDFGIVSFDENDQVTSIVEKPTSIEFDDAIAGLYKFDQTFFEKFKTTKPSLRNEYEIVDIISSYKGENALVAVKSLSAIDFWLDMGTLENLQSATTFISSLQEQNSLNHNSFYKDN